MTDFTPYVEWTLDYIHRNITPQITILDHKRYTNYNLDYEFGAAILHALVDLKEVSYVIVPQKLSLMLSYDDTPETMIADVGFRTSHIETAQALCDAYAKQFISGVPHEIISDTGQW